MKKGRFMRRQSKVWSTSITSMTGFTSQIRNTTFPSVLL